MTMLGLDIIGARTKQTVGAEDDDTNRRRILHDVNSALKEAAAFIPALVLLGADVDVAALIERFDSLPSTNRTVWSLWVDNGHGSALASRVTADAQKLLSDAIIPTTEFAFHDAVTAFDNRYKALSDKVTAQPLDDSQSPIWADVKAYFVDGSKFANLLEGTANQTLKWSDVKDAATAAAKGVGGALGSVGSAVKWTTYGIVGGAVLLGVGALYVIYKIVSGPTGGAIIGGYLGGRRR